MSNKRFFKIMLIVIGTLFFFTCFSIIFCLLNSSMISDTQSSSHIMSIVYMFLQLIIEAVSFYYSFKAMVNGSMLLKTVMYDANGNLNKKSKRNSLIVLCIFGTLSVYLSLIIFFENLFLGFFALGLKFALLNFSILMSALAVFFFAYRTEEK